MTGRAWLEETQRRLQKGATGGYGGGGGEDLEASDWWGRGGACNLAVETKGKAQGWLPSGRESSRPQKGERSLIRAPRKPPRPQEWSSFSPQTTLTGVQS